MLSLLWLVPALPLAGFLILATLGRRLPKRAIAGVGAGSIGVAALVMSAVAVAFLLAPPPGDAFVQRLWTWWHVNGLEVDVGLRLDALSLVMVLVVTWVGCLIHLYATEFMTDEDGYGRFFAYMNLFVGFMVVLLLADHFVLLLLGWEGVGLCSYLLIGFWYREPGNGRAARKAFIVTRIGDVALTIGLLLTFHALGTLNIQQVMDRASVVWGPGSAMAATAALLLLGGAVGKSAQLPLQTWLPDAMAGPTPVSALIHAATMVTAGVYLIARTHVLFALAPSVMLLVAAIGTITLLLAGFAALAQDDIKRVLAYSTISQIGYMFLALGVGAWSAAIFHFMTHAYFKALLFLGAGVVIHAFGGEHDIHRMGGLRKRLPVTFWTFLIASAALAGLPLVTAGFYSKDLILSRAYLSPGGSAWLWAGALLGAVLTGLYIFRVVFLAFFGAAPRDRLPVPGWRIRVPLVVLGALSLVGGFVELPDTLGGFHPFSGLMRHALPGDAGHAGLAAEGLLQAAAAGAALLGIAVAWVLFLRHRTALARVRQTRTGEMLLRWWRAGFGFDRLYDLVIVRPYVWLARVNRDDVVDRVVTAIADLSLALNRSLVTTQNGRLRWYASGIALGAALVVALAMFT